MADDRAELSAFLEAFPGREGWAAKLFAEGKTLTEARLLLAEAREQEFAAVQAEVESLRAKVAELESDRVTVASLRTESRAPGVGFDAPARETAGTPETPIERMSPDQAWERSAELRSEFFNSKKAFDAFVAREGWE